jgi:FkbM family methyltransferase
MSVRYTQNDEDTVILRALDGIERGLVIDVGAYDGVTFSNSRRLIEMGWDAVLVEPAPSALSCLRSLYAEEDRVAIVPAALAVAEGEVRLLAGTGSGGHEGLLTTTVYGEAERSAARYAIEFVETTCRATTWSALFAEFGHGAHFISIDTEGTSVDRFLELDLDALTQLRLVCVERDFVTNHEPCPVAHARAVSFAADHFFALVHETAENLLFERCD